MLIVRRSTHSRMLHGIAQRGTRSVVGGRVRVAAARGAMLFRFRGGERRACRAVSAEFAVRRSTHSRASNSTSHFA